VNERSLPLLQAGQVATIRRIATTNGCAKRLADMGFLPGVRIEMVRPGTPCIVRIGGTWVGLGREHQQDILININEG
jgi:Fe2+ transport system protein FeoA